MIALYCSTGNVNVEPVELFVELADVEPIQNVTPLSQQYGVQDPFMEGEDFSDPDLDEVLDDIDEEGTEDGENVYAPSVENPTRVFSICNDPKALMLSVDLNAAYAPEFLKYPNIIPSQRLAENLDSQVLFISQQFTTKKDCVFVIKREKHVHHSYINLACRHVSTALVSSVISKSMVDETWLYGKHMQILLIAVAQYDNKNMLPISFSIVELKNMELWQFFLKNLWRCC
ncbi:hypothetical protein GOBAR_AA02535 [Gossypium barbadense]|uniref:MULE transposase domain-containing protein n=1 Tax=Gossypium barbadense TaxID=3634 RepID=A0A2P5YR07_GOSBA|nr:hypothetical protein GOBAR_AA02535 [Gossypium barbadense]